jgi:hypothetical protein
MLLRLTHAVPFYGFPAAHAAITFRNVGSGVCQSHATVIQKPGITALS